MKRERSPRELASIIGEKAERAIYDLRFENFRRAEKVIQLIENAEKKEFEEIKRVTDSEKIQEEIEQVYRMTEEAEKALRNENAEKVKEFLERIVRIESMLYEQLEEASLDQNFEIKKEPLGEGYEGVVYETVGSEGLLIKIAKNHTDPKEFLEKKKRHLEVERQIPESVNIARIRRVGYFEDRPAVLLERAPGREVHWVPGPESKTGDEEWYGNWSQMNKVMASSPLNHFKKLVKDLEILRKNSLKVETKSDNFFFHPDAGFTILDVSIERGGMGEVSPPDILEVLVFPEAVKEFGYEKITENDRENVRNIQRKVERVGNPCQDQVKRERTKEAIKRLIYQV